MATKLRRYGLYYIGLFFIETLICILLDQLFKYAFLHKTELSNVSQAFKDEAAWTMLRLVYMGGFHLALFIVFNLYTSVFKNVLLNTILINVGIYLILFGMYAIANKENLTFFDLKFGFFYYTLIGTILSPLVLSVFNFYSTDTK